MRISIGHVTRYAYGEPVQYSIQTLRLTPPNFVGQHVVDWLITAPGMDHPTVFRDNIGNLAHLVTRTGPHSENVIIAKGTVETEDRAGVIQGLHDVTPVRVFLRETEKTKADDAIRELAEKTCPIPNISSFHRLMNAIRDAVDYEVGATHEHTNAIEAFRDGRGVCQDHAHIFIAAARAIGRPARYVNGYFYAGVDEPAEAHHAWAEVWIDDLGWVGFDCANRVCPTDRYVRLVTGFDAASAAPIRGSRRGGAKEELDVVVEVQQQKVQQQ